MKRMSNRGGGATAATLEASSIPLSDAELGFSRHALARMASRGIDLTVGQRTRLGDAMGSLSAKGGRHALILLDQIALVVSVKRRRVVTVVGQQALREHVFTNIDCAMLA